MKILNYFIYLFGIAFTTFTFANAKSRINLPKPDASKDQNYLIFVENVYGEISIFSKDKSRFNKREEASIFVESLVDKIHNIIIDNKDTYKDKEKLEEREKENSKLRKRNESSNEWSSDLVYPISSVNNSTILLAYLSKDLVKKVESLDHVKKCLPDMSMKPDESNTYYNIEDIKKNTNWKGVKIQKEASQHLSILSQGKYDRKVVHRYDDNFYYPESAGKDIDIVILDTSFNFKYNEFNNTNERSVKCVAHIKNGKADTKVSKDKCHGKYVYQHGEQVADIAGGLTYGVAKRSNIYGISHELDEEFRFPFSEMLAGFQFVSENLIRPHKTVINYSASYTEDFYEDEDDESYFTSEFHEIINKITDKGAILVSSAGNDGKKLSKSYRSYPCYFENTICAGGLNEETYRTDIDTGSNYGNHVDIYAPYNVELVYKVVDGEIINRYNQGTSFSSPLTAGTIATIMSDNPGIKFNYKTMMEYLEKIGIHDKSRRYERMPIVRLNNGKHIVYSKDDIYFGCGETAGNRPCNSSSTKTTTTTTTTTTTVNVKTTPNTTKMEPTTTPATTTTTTTTTTKKEVPTSTVSGRCGPDFGSCSKPDQCCSKYGYCGTSSKHCGSGCQYDFGVCK